jgi:hypothetical protein
MDLTRARESMVWTNRDVYTIEMVPRWYLYKVFTAACRLTKMKIFIKIMRPVTTGTRVGRRDASPRGIMPPISSSSIRLKQRVSNNAGYAIAVVALRTASEIMTRVTPLMIMLTPTSVPIAQAELDGH